MRDAAAEGRRLSVALDLEDLDLRDALAEALEAHPWLGLDEATGPPVAVVISDRALGLKPGDPPVLTLAGDGVPRSADVEVILAAAHLAAAGYAIAPRPASAQAATSGLSVREREVLILLVDGASNKAIARGLGISVHTAKFHVAAVLQKLDARSRSQAVAFALRDGLVVL